jgi:cytochrome c-type biogenesis protein CcmH/NrfG
MEEYQEMNDKVTKLLMKAQYMEEQQAIYTAYQTYEEAMQLDASNSLIKQALAAFLIRQGLVDAAEGVLGL